MLHIVNKSNRLRFAHFTLHLRLAEIFDVNTVPPTVRHSGLGPFPTACRNQALFMFYRVIHDQFLPLRFLLSVLTDIVRADRLHIGISGFLARECMLLPSLGQSTPTLRSSGPSIRRFPKHIEREKTRRRAGGSVGGFRAVHTSPGFLVLASVFHWPK